MKSFRRCLVVLTIALLIGALISCPETSSPKAWVVSTLAGDGTNDHRDGAGDQAQFSKPFGVATDSAGNLYVADKTNHRIRKIVLATGEVSTLAGDGRNNAGNADGGGFLDHETGTSAKFNSPSGVATDSAGENLYVADSNNHRIRKIELSGSYRVSTIAGDGRNDAGNADGGGFRNHGTGTMARFNHPTCVAVDSAGENLYVADYNNHRIRKIVLSGNNPVSTLAGDGGHDGNPDRGGFRDHGTGTMARFDRPIGVALDSADNLYVADTYNHRIRKIELSGSYRVSTIAGDGRNDASNADGGGFRDHGTGTMARFDTPYCVAVDSSGENLYVADYNNHRIRKIVLSGNNPVSTIAGDGRTGQFNHPKGVTVDSSGNLYVADSENHRIRKIMSP